MPYSLEYTETAERDLSRLDAGVAQQMCAALTRMAENVEVVRHRALTGPRYRGQFRLRMGRYRAIYELDAPTAASSFFAFNTAAKRTEAKPV